MSLERVLRETSRAAVRETKTGKILVGMSANGHDYTYEVPAAASHLGAPAILEICSDLYDLMERSVASYAAAGIPNPTDEQIVESMLAGMIVRTVRQLDFTGATR